jgi:hypothetical protein
MLREQSEVEPGHGLQLRPATKAAAERGREEAAARARAEEEASARVREAERQSALRTAHGLLPGHKGYVEPPERLYHATFAADKIEAEGFRGGDDPKSGGEVLGGSSGHLVSFASKEDAEHYRNALEAARLSAQGKMNKAEFVDRASKFGVSRERAAEIADAHEGTDYFDAWQQVSAEGLSFPMFMGGGWTETVRQAGPAGLVSIPSSSAGEIYYVPSEREWRLNPRGLPKPAGNGG